MLKLIEEMLDARFKYDDTDAYAPLDECGTDIVGAVRQIFVNEEFDYKDYVIELNVLYQGEGFSVAVLSVTYYDWGKVHLENYKVISY